MAETNSAVTMETIQNVVRQIVGKFRPQRVILFGSHAYGEPTEDSDLDLLVVMETDAENPLQVAHRIREAIDAPVRMWMGHSLHVWVDIHVMTPSEFEAAIARRGVFVTTIATNGIVLYEAPGATPIEAVIPCGGARRSTGMKYETLEWVNKAESDWTAMQWQLQAPTPVYDLICFLAQQCVEKYLKAFLEEHNITFPKTHDLEELLNLSGGQLSELDPLRPDLAKLKPFAVNFRYPSRWANQQNAEEAVKTAQKVRTVVRAKLGLP